MTHPPHHSTPLGNGSSQNIPQGIAEPSDQATAEVDFSDQPPNSTLNLQTLQILDSSDDCIKVLDLEGRILFMNRGGQALLGIQDMTPFLNRFWVNFWQEGERQAAIDAIARAAAGEVCFIQGYCPTMNGEPKWWDTKISPILGADGNVERLLGISRDITERRRIEEERHYDQESLRQSGERLSAIFSHAAVGLSEISLEGRFQRVNDELCKMLRRSRQDLLAASVPDVTHPDDVSRSQEAFGQLVETGEPVSFDKRYLRSDGTIVWANSSLTRLDDEQGHPRSVLAVTVDLSDRRQAEEALRKSEEEFRLFTAASSDTVYKMSADWREMRLLEGKNFLASTQQPNQTWLEQYIPIEEQTRVRAASEHAIRTKSTFELEHQVIQLDGTIGWTFSRAIPLLNEHNELVEWLGAASNVTARKRAELSAEFLAIVTQNLVEATCVEDIIQTVGEQLHHYLQISNCAFVEVNESAEVAQIDHSWHQADVPSLIGSYHLAEFVTGEFFQAAKLRQTIIVRDVATDPRIANPQRFAALKIGAFINVPLIRNDEWKFTLGIYYPTPYNWRSDEIELMRELANRIWIKLERTRVEIALRQNQEMFSALVADAPFGVYMIDAEFRLQQANQTAIAAFNVGSLLGRDLAEALRIIWQEPFATEAIDRFRHVLATGESFYSPPIVEPRADIAEIQAYDWQLHRITLPNGRYGVVCYFYDLSEIKRAEEIVRRNADRDAFLITLNDALRPLTNAIAIQATASRVLGEYLAVSRVAYFEVRGEDYFVEQDYVNGVESLQGGYPIASFGATVLATYRIGQTATSTNVAIDPQFSPEQRSAHTGIQIAAYIGVPLVKQGEFVAGLAVHSASPRKWTLNEIALAEDVAERTWAAVERARVEEALRESEAKYRSLFESIDQGFCLFELLFDANGKPFDYRFVDVNQAFEQQCGLVGAVGKTILELAPNFEPQWIDRYAQVAKSGEAIRFEADVPSLNGIFDIYAFPSGAPGQNRVAALFANITERKQTEAAIAADLRDTQLLHELSARLTTEENTQALYQEITAAAVALTHADAGTVQILDETTQDLLLIATQGFEQQMVEHLHRVNASSNTSCGIALRNSMRSFVDFEVPASEDPDGSMRLHVEAGLLSAQSTPLISRSGKTIGMVSTHWRARHRPRDRELRFLDLLSRQAADLIEQRQAEAQRKQLLEQEQAAREEAERANRIKDEFLAVLSHELRSPLNPILGWARLLQNGKLDATRQREALVTIERNAKLQTQLIEDLLDISRIMRGKLSLTIAPVSLPFVISAAVETVRLAADAKNIQVILDLAPDVALVSGDAARLQQVVWNLLTNAVKFTSNGGQVTVELRQRDRLAQIRVIDTGKGINPQFLPHVFEYFLQEDGSTTRKFGGLGLGLAIVRQIVQMHGGDVWAESQGEGMGATFVVELPLLQRTENQGLRTEDLALSTQSSALSTPLAGIHILLVDDEPDTREFQAILLEQSGAKVTAVASGLEALQALEQLIPDVIVSDIGMPEMDGYMLLQQIHSRLSEQGGNIPAIALTAYAAEIDQQRAIQVGFQKHITKPVEPEALVKAVSTLLKRT